MIFRRIIPILPLLSLLGGCGQESRAILRSEVPSTHSDTATLGQAFHSGRKKFLNVNCVEGDVTEDLGNTQGQFEMKNDLSFNDLVDRIGGRLSVDSYFPTVRAGASARYATDNTATATANSYHFFWSATPKKRTLKKDASGRFRLTDFGRGPTAAASCGDEFVTSIEYGATLAVTMKMEYRNEQDKQDIGGKLKVDALSGAVSVAGSLDYLSQEIKKSVRITIEAQQQGGRPMHLLQIIPENLATCSLDNPNVCFQIFSAAIAYAKEDLPTQFTSLDAYNVIKYTTQRYDDSGLTELQPAGGYPIVAVLVEDARQNLDQLLQEALLDRARVRKMISTYREWLNELEFEALTIMERQATANVNRLANAAVFCYDQPYPSCLKRAEDVLEQLQIYDRRALSIRTQPLIAYERCEQARQAAVKAGAASEKWSLAYRSRGDAPVFISNAKPEEGIRTWGPCAEALDYYGEFFQP